MKNGGSFAAIFLIFPGCIVQLQLFSVQKQPETVPKGGYFVKKLPCFLLILTLILSHAMCAVTAFEYRGMLCGIEHLCYSAPASYAFLSAIPFAIGILLCLLLAWFLHRKSK